MHTAGIDHAKVFLPRVVDEFPTHRAGHVKESYLQKQLGVQPGESGICHTHQGEAPVAFLGKVPKVVTLELAASALSWASALALVLALTLALPFAWTFALAFGKAFPTISVFLLIPSSC